MRFAGANLTVNPDDFVRKLVNRYTGDFLKHVTSTILQGGIYGSQFERNWYSYGKRATSSVKELENEDLSQSM